MTHSNFATSNKLGLPLKQPSKQSMLPILCGHDSLIRGFLPIAVYTFDGTETSLTIDGIEVPITTVTLPPVVSDGTGTRVEQYMAIVYPTEVQLQRPWIGFTQLVLDDEAQYLGAKHVMPTQGWKTRYYLGPLVTNLMIGMANDTYVPPVQTPPTVVPATLRWVASMKTNPTGLDCQFFDFNWVDLFKASTTDIDPLSITIVSNPTGGYFKSTLVPTPVIAPLGGVQYNTVRIIRLAEAPPADYVFTYKITDTNNQSTNATFTLTVV